MPWQLSVPIMITIYASITQRILTILLLIEINNALSSYIFAYNLIDNTEIKKIENRWCLYFCIAMPEKPTMSDNENPRFWIWISLEALAFLQHWQKVFSLSLPSIFLTSISPVYRKGKYTTKMFCWCKMQLLNYLWLGSHLNVQNVKIRFLQIIISSKTYSNDKLLWNEPGSSLFLTYMPRHMADSW